MSQENNLNLNIDEILNKIKEVSPEEVKNNNLYGIPGNRILIYKDIILALENNSDDEQIMNKFFLLADDVYAYNAVIEWLDVEIIMGFIDKILEKADNKNPENQHWSNIIEYLFNSLGKSSRICGDTGKIPQNIDIKQIIDLADKVLKCGNVTHAVLPVAVDNVFAIISHVTLRLSNSNTKIGSQNMSDIITLIYNVVNDDGIKWNNSFIASMTGTLVCLVINANLDSEKSQADGVANDIVEILRKLTGRLKPDKPDLTDAINKILNLFSYMLITRKNLANLSAAESMKLIGQLLKKINVLNPNVLNPNENGKNNLRLAASYVSNIVCYYSKNQENVEIITDCGFNIDKENGQIQSLDTDKLKEFAGEFMADQIDHYVYRIRKSKIYQEIMSMISAENSNDIDDGPLTGLIFNFRDELKRYFMDGNTELEDVVAVINLLDKFLECHLEKSNIIYHICMGLCDIVYEIPPKNEKLTEQEQNQIKAVIGFVEKVLRSDERVTISTVPYGCFVVLDALLINNVIGTEYYEKVAGFLKDVITIANDEAKSLLVDTISRMWGIMIDKNKNLTETYGNDIVNFIKRVANTEFPSDNPLGSYQLQSVLCLMLDILRAKPELLQAKEGLEIVKSLLNKPVRVDKGPEKANMNELKLADKVLQIIILYCNQNKQENIEIIKKCGFRMVNGEIEMSDSEKLEEFAGVNMAVAILKYLIAKGKSKGQNERNNLNDNNEIIRNTEMPKKQDDDNLGKKPEEQMQITNIKGPTSNNCINTPLNSKNLNEEQMDNHQNEFWMLNRYDDANGLLTASNLSTESINQLLKNVKVSFWDKFKRFFSWLWFMIRNIKMVSLGTYTKAAKYYSGKQNQTQDNNEEIASLGNKIQDALDKSAHDQLGPEVEENDQNKEKEQEQN